MKEIWPVLYAIREKENLISHTLGSFLISTSYFMGIVNKSYVEEFKRHTETHTNCFKVSTVIYGANAKRTNTGGTMGLSTGMA